MSKVTVPKNLMKMVQNIDLARWDETKEKFIDKLHDLYPHLTYDECLSRFIGIMDRDREIEYKKDNIKDYKKDMVDRYKRYQRYKKFNDTESLNNCKQFYLGIDKK